MKIDKLTGDEDEPILELLNQAIAEKKEDKKLQAAEEEAEVIESRKEKSTINTQDAIYKENVEELNMIILAIFKSVEKILGLIAKGNVGFILLRPIGELAGLLFAAKKLYAKKRFSFRLQERTQVIAVFRRFSLFNKTTLVNSMAPNDRVKRMQYLQYLNK